jgi:hypothetical protein
MARTSARGASGPRGNLLLGGLFAACLVALVVLSIYVLPDRLVARDVGAAAVGQLEPPQLLKAKDDVRKTLLQGIGGLLFLATAFFTWRQLATSREQLRHNVESSHIQHELDRQGQITEQFNKAIDHLGNDQVDVRLGGIYALERIAITSKDERGPIVEVLTAYIREHAPRPAVQDDTPDPATLKAPKADVQAAAIVLARRATDGDRGADLDLTGVDLRKAYLASPKVRAAKLQRVNFQEALLQASNLQAADLGNADLWQVDLRWSNLQSANLRKAYLHEADLREADLREADLREADLRETQLQGVDLRGAKLEETRLEGANADRRTRWPDGFTARAETAGIRFVDG